MTDLATYRATVKAAPYSVAPAAAALYEKEIAARMRTFCDRERPDRNARLERMYGGEAHPETRGYFGPGVIRYLASGATLSSRQLALAIGTTAATLRHTLHRLEREGEIERAGIHHDNGTLWRLRG